MRLRHLALLAVAWSGQTQAAPETLSLSCAVAYMPARSTWVRQVQIELDDSALLAVRIDGLAPYSFSIEPDGLSTAIDNERIRIDLRQSQWFSDFRGLATGQGRCESD